MPSTQQVSTKNEQEGRKKKGRKGRGEGKAKRPVMFLYDSSTRHLGSVIYYQLRELCAMETQKHTLDFETRAP